MKTMTRTMRAWATCGALAALTLLAAAPAAAQVDPAAIGAGQMPYILIVMDTSGSMEWTAEGKDMYPAYGTSLGSHQERWESVDKLMDIGEGAGRATGPESFGPCYVWEHPSCADYERPPWSANAPASWYANVPAGDLMEYRLNSMRGIDGASPPPMRLTTLNQPRHVTLKEVLTGDMVLRPYASNTLGAITAPVSEFSASDYGPGCWFVPRQRDSSSGDPDNPNNKVCKGVAGEVFELFPDFRAVRPHFQEMWDGQVRNGVMDSLSSTAIFAVAMFDGYQNPADGSDKIPAWPGELNDRITGSRPGSRAGEEGATNTDPTGTPGEFYDLGIYEVVGPKNLQIPSGKLGQLSTFTQLALLDAGYLSLRNGGSDTDWELRPDSTMPYWIGASFDDDLRNYIEPYHFGRQPMDKATPLAAAVHDVHQYMLHGYVPDVNDPIQTDRFGSCRQKHVVLLTDGTPEPEKGTGLGSNYFDPAYGYFEDLYTYDITEEEIAALVTNLGIPGNETDNYKVKVHVVGLNQAGADNFTQVVDKLTSMAVAGGTCARAEESGVGVVGLGDSWVPPLCNDPGNGCLIPQSSYDIPDPREEPGSGVTIPCQYPALILDSNDPRLVQKALVELFQGVVGSAGLTSRTRTVVTDYLDNVTDTNDFTSTSDVIGGQYRFYSGIKIGGSPYWQGILNRQHIACDDGVEWAAFHEEIATQVDLSDPTAPTDTRRVFTSLPNAALVDYDDTQPTDYNRGPRPIPGGAKLPFIFTYDLQDTSTGADEFKETYLRLTGAEVDDVLGTRIPFEHDTLTAAIGGSTTDVAYDYLVVGGGDTSQRKQVLSDAIDLYRGRHPDKVDRVLGGILNGNPVVVTPPDLDLPIGSYRQFKARYGDRPTMLYVPTVDGQLHAIHSGVLRSRLRIRKPNDPPTDEPAINTETAALQREAWSFIPNMILRKLVAAVGGQPYFLDATPSVKDVRLCQSLIANNQNNQACVEACDTGMAGQTICPPALQWRTVLVQGLGEGGAGYFAMDVTRPGGYDPLYSGSGTNIRNPDPILLWEFDREWERVQVAHLSSKKSELVMPADPTFASDATIPNSCMVLTGNNAADAQKAFWHAPMLGLSISDPEIATLQVTVESTRQQRPVAIFGGGALDSNSSTKCGDSAAGQAIYVVDLQTGSLLRRFMDYSEPGDSPSTPKKRFAAVDSATDEPIQFVGSPALYDAFPGSVATRGFIGDNHGRLFRIDFRDPDPEDWSVSLFFDPATSTDFWPLVDEAETKYSIGIDTRPFGPAAFKPAIALTEERDFVIVYGLGDKTDVTPQGQNQAVIALRESSTDLAEAALEWGLLFEPGEKLTGEPVIFDRAVYFPTYAVPTEDVCTAGTARIYSVGYLCPADVGCDSTKPKPTGLVTVKTEVTDTDTGVLVDTADNRWFGPEEKTLIRGLTLTLNRSCSLSGVGTDPIFNDGAEPQPQLIAQTGSVGANAHNNTDLGGAGGGAAQAGINRMVVDIQPPRSQLMPLGWSIVSN